MLIICLIPLIQTKWTFYKDEVKKFLTLYGILPDDKELKRIITDEMGGTFKNGEYEVNKENVWWYGKS